MKQVLQDLARGVVTMEDLPVPDAPAGFVLARNACSILSAGTESAQLAASKAGALDKVRERPELIGRALRMARDQGLSALFKKLGAGKSGFAPLGYSCAAVVEQIGSGVSEFRPGQRVACAGVGYAVHAEYVCVPRNLCAAVPEGVSYEAAAYTTLGAIALQGVRQARVELGECVAVIGLGLIGLLTVELLKAAGCSVLGLDPAEPARRRGRASGCDDAVDPAQAPGALRRLSRGLGADAVIICASASGDEPVRLAGELARSRGRVVMVGATGMTIPRQLYFEKELSFSLSRSYGPGRYDPTYEEGGLDYPPDYVRFTEQRNMDAFLALAAAGKISPERLTTHRFDFAEAIRAYAVLGDKSEDRAGIVLRYPDAPAPAAARIEWASAPAGGVAARCLGVSLIGAGAYARSMLMPIVARNPAVRLRGVADQRGAAALAAAKAHGFAFVAARPEEVLADAETQVVFIATRHDSHAQLAVDSLRAGKHVWVEKPLALTLDEVRAVAAAARERPACRVLVGFNRRFSPLTVFLRERLGGGPVMLHYRINAGAVPANHWTQDPVLGGGRLIGEGCHFLDLACHLARSRPASVLVRALESDRRDLLPAANFTAVVRMENGAVATILYSAQGSPLLPKECLEVFGENGVGRLEDFRRAEWYGAGRALRHKAAGQDKGQAGLVEAFFQALAEGRPAPISMEELLYSSALTLAAQRSLEGGGEIAVEPIVREVLA